VSVISDGAESPLHRLLDAVSTLGKGYRELPVFFDELNNALEAHDAEECGRIAGTVRALFARHDENEEAELFPLAQAR